MEQIIKKGIRIFSDSLNNRNLVVFYNLVSFFKIPVSVICTLTGFYFFYEIFTVFGEIISALLTLFIISLIVFFYDISIVAFLSHIFTAFFTKNEVRFTIPFIYYSLFLFLFIAISVYTSYNGINSLSEKVSKDLIVESKKQDLQLSYDSVKVEMVKEIKELEMAKKEFINSVSYKGKVSHSYNKVLSDMETQIIKARENMNDKLKDLERINSIEIEQSIHKAERSVYAFVLTSLILEFVKIFLYVTSYTFIYVTVKTYDDFNDNVITDKILSSDNANGFYLDKKALTLSQSVSSEKIGFKLPEKGKDVSASLRVCVVCGSDISHKRSHATTCSPKCRQYKSLSSSIS